MPRDYDEDEDLLGLEDEEGSVDPEAPEREAEAEDASADPDERRQTRNEKRKERGELFKALQESQTLNRELSAQLAQSRSPAPPQQQGPQVDPYQAAIMETMAEEQRIRENARSRWEAGQASGKPLTQEQVNEFDNQLRMQDIKRQNLIAERAARLVYAQANPAGAAQREAIHAQYADVRANDAALQWADAVYRQRVIERGQKAEGPELLAEVMRDARAKFRIGTPERSRGPSEGDRRRFVSAGGGAMAGGGARRQSSGGQLTTSERRLAETMYDKFPPEKAHAMFRKTVLSKMGSEE